MEMKRIYLFVGVPLAGAALIAAALVFRSAETAPKAPSKLASSKSASYASGAVYAPARLESAPPPAPPEKIAQATDTVRIRGTYQNFRRAVAAKDAGLQDQILPALLRDRASARQCAEEDLARAQSDLDRDIARRVIEALRR
jgi:hypothetical protein